jgi:hypothetical protein
VLGASLNLLTVDAAAAQASRIDELAWLAGCWQLQAGARTTTEMWMPPAGGLMVGGSRTVVGGTAREFEHLRVSARGDTLIYTAIPSGQSETHFRSASVSGSEVVFENRAHDFPQVIRYRRVGADSLIARVEGPGSGGATRAIDFPMARVGCDGAPSLGSLGGVS